VKYILLIEDTKDVSRKGKIRFKSLDEVVEHVQWIVLNGIVDELYELALQDDPSSWKDQIERVYELAQTARKARTEEEIGAVLEEWNDLVNDNVFNEKLELIS